MIVSVNMAGIKFLKENLGSESISNEFWLCM